MIFLKTEAGHQALKARSPLLTARQRAVFIIVDGIKSTAQVQAAAVGLGATPEDIDHLVAQGFLVAVPKITSAVFAQPSQPADLVAAEPEAIEVSAAPVGARSPRERYTLAMPMATKLTADLGLRGFMLNLAVEAASGYDGLLELLPRIQKAAGIKACELLEQTLKGS